MAESQEFQNFFSFRGQVGMIFKFSPVLSWRFIDVFIMENEKADLMKLMDHIISLLRFFLETNEKKLELWIQAQFQKSRCSIEFCNLEDQKPPFFVWTNPTRKSPSRGDSPIDNWLVVGPPLWKIWVRQLGWWDSQFLWENKIDVNQTTNQIILINGWNNPFKGHPWYLLVIVVWWSSMCCCWGPQSVMWTLL